jgi:hypothetical protein
MTKPFRVEERVRELTSVLREGRYGPQAFYAHLVGKGVDWKRSVLVESVFDQGPSLCGKLIDNRGCLISFDIEFNGSGVDPRAWNEIASVNSWQEADLAGEWWRTDRPAGTQPQPNDPILVGLRLLKETAAG